jgi:YD repeat-containing protein
MFVRDFPGDGSSRETEYAYDFYDEVAGVILPERNGTVTGRDGRNNVSSVTQASKTGGQPGLTTTYTYATSCTSANEAWCNRPIAETDPMGNTTDYEYNQAGQITKEIAPAPEAGGARPTIINEYTWRQAYIKTANGGVEHAGPEISLMTKSYTCISSANCNANTPASDKVVTEYDYGPDNGLNNLLLRGIAVTAVNSQGQMETLRTCYTYNYFGERISETQPKADLASCPA